MKSKIKNAVSFFLFFIIITISSIFSIGNKSIVKINFFPVPYYIELPLYILIFSLLFVGFLLGFLFFYLRKTL